MIEQYSLNHLRELLDKNIVPEGLFDEAVREYKRYMFLVRNYSPLGMFSRAVDEVWHCHLDTPDYVKFCEQAVGCFVHHVPGSMHDRAHFEEAYKAVFLVVPPPAIWGQKSPSCGGLCGGVDSRIV